MLLPIIMVIWHISLSAQTILFQEDFEITPITSIANTFGDTVITGPSPCGQASRGDTSDLNSTQVNYTGDNLSYFLGVNPELCGGFYNATLESDSIDFTGYDYLTFACKYFKSDTIHWGQVMLQFVFDNGTTTDTIKDVFTTKESWDNIEVRLSDSMISENVFMTIQMGGGEAIGIDDITVSGHSCITDSSFSITACNSYTVPSNDETYTSSGIYNDTIPNIAGCDSVLTIDLTINSADTSVIQNADTLRAVSTGAVYQWLDCDNDYAALPGETQRQFITTENGNYALEITENGCTDTSACFAVTTVKIKRTTLTDAIYPNPVEDFLNISSDNIMPGHHVILSDTYGRTIIQRRVNKTDKLFLDVRDIEPGAYILNIAGSHGESKTYKIIKK